MAETTKAELKDEVSDLHARIKELEAELDSERGKHKSKKKNGIDDDVRRSLDTVNEQMTKLTRGLFFAGLEAMALSAKFTRDFVDRVDERSSPHRRDTWAKMMTDLPVDATKGFTDALENSADDIEKVVDKFYAKYKE
jgi:hypothetical protein